MALMNDKFNDPLMEDKRGPSIQLSVFPCCVHIIESNDFDFVYAMYKKNPFGDKISLEENSREVVLENPSVLDPMVTVSGVRAGSSESRKLVLLKRP
jgi:hypothetical protein